MASEATATSEPEEGQHGPELSEEELEIVRTSESIDGDEEFMKDIFGMLAKSIEEKMVEIDEGWKSKDYGVIWKSAHSLKGSGLQCALDKFGEAAKAVESHFRVLESGDQQKGTETATAAGEIASEKPQDEVSVATNGTSSAENNGASAGGDTTESAVEKKPNKLDPAIALIEALRLEGLKVRNSAKKLSNV